MVQVELTEWIYEWKYSEYFQIIVVEHLTVNYDDNPSHLIHNQPHLNLKLKKEQNKYKQEIVGK